MSVKKPYFKDIKIPYVNLSVRKMNGRDRNQQR